MTHTRTLTEPLRGVNTLQQKHLAALANDLCSQVAKDCWSQQHRELSQEIIDRLIDRYPSQHLSGCIGLLINSSS